MNQFSELYGKFLRRTAQVHVKWMVETIASAQQLDPTFPDNPQALLEDHPDPSVQEILLQYRKKRKHLEFVRIEYGMKIVRRRDTVESEIPAHQQALRQKIFNC